MALIRGVSSKLNYLMIKTLREQFSKCRCLCDMHRESAVRSYGTGTMDGNDSDGVIRPHEAVQQTTKKLVEVGICPEEAESSAGLIVSKVLGCNTLFSLPSDVLLQPGQLEMIRKLSSKRETRMPVQYVIGETDFSDLQLKMEPPVFIPRPETEDLVHHVLRHISESETDVRRFLEIGCGSGAISLSLLARATHLKAHALDISLNACNLTKHNAKKLGLSERISVFNMDVQDDACVEFFGELFPFDLIVSNPPYVTTEEMKLLEPEIYKFEDHKALSGGEDGLTIVRAIFNMSQSILAPGGVLWLEVGLQHPVMIKTFLEENPSIGLKYVATFQDFTNRERFCLLMK